MCATLKCTCTFVSIRSIKIFGIWPHVRTQTDRHTYTHVLQCSHASVGLAQARPNLLYQPLLSYFSLLLAILLGKGANS